jgi:hypothetical protein
MTSLRALCSFAAALGLSLFAAGCGARTLEDYYVPSDAGADTLVDASISYDAAPPPTGQKLLFELGYVNWAWGFTFSGAYVNAAGEVWSYSYPQSTTTPPVPTPQLKPGMTEAEITAKYAYGAKLVGTLSKADLATAWALVDGAEKGTLVRQSNCADAGEFTFVAWRWDAAANLYSPITLAIHGDLAARSTAPEATQLVAFLQKATGTDGFDSCAPRTPYVCAGTGCGVGACKAWETAACDGKCVNPTGCDAVNDCGKCGSGRSCVLDAAGGVHCSATNTCATGDTGCACLGDQVCAGGAAWCKDTTGGAMKCVRP